MNIKKITLVILTCLIFISILLIPYTLTIPNTTPFLTPNEVKRLYPNSTTIIDTIPNLRITINMILIGLVIIIFGLFIYVIKIKNKKVNSLE